MDSNGVDRGMSLLPYQPPKPRQSVYMVRAKKPDDEYISEKKARLEILKCAISREYFIDSYAKIYDPAMGGWIPFKLWKSQRRVLRIFSDNKQVAALKARQMGLSWLAIAYAVHQMVFQPIAEVLIFSKHEREAAKLLGEERLRGMYFNLPKWMQAERVIVDKYTEFRLSNGSGATAFPSSAGDSYTATLAIVDEADLIQDLGKLLGRVEPTVEAGGQIFLISKADKDKPNSYFKSIYSGAREGKNAYAPMFLGWHEHPGRDQAWYDDKVQHHLTTDGSLDNLHENYPATEQEALSARTMNKRIPARHLERCYDDLLPVVNVGFDDADLLPMLADGRQVPNIPGLVIYEMPRPGKRYVIGIDAAQGKEESNDTAFTVLELTTLVEVAHLSGLIEPTLTAKYAHDIGAFFNDAAVMPERNNHGHVIISWLNENSHLEVMLGMDGDWGWLSNGVGKFVLYNTAADSFRSAQTTVRTLKTFRQLGDINRNTLRASANGADDCADSYALALCGAQYGLIMSGWGGSWNDLNG